jgi:hypothetical protein
MRQALSLWATKSYTAACWTSFLLDFYSKLASILFVRFVKEAFPWHVEPFLSVTIVGKK